MQRRFTNIPKPKAVPNLLATKAEAKFQQALAFHQKGQLSQAQSLYEEILKTQPKHFDSLHLLGVIAHQTKNHQRAVDLIGKAIELFPKNATLYSNRGLALQELKQLDAAVASYDKAIALKADYANAYYNRGIALKELKQLDAAVASYDKAIALKADYAEAYINRGLALQELKQLDAAVASYDKAIALKADYAEAYSNRGVALKELKRYDEAFVAYDKAIVLKPDLENAWLGRGNVFYDLKRYDEAFAAYDKAIALKPDLENAWLGRGNVFYSLNRDEEALTCYDKAISLKKDLPDGYRDKSLLKLSLGEYEEGWQLYEWRWKVKHVTSPVRNFSQPLWLGNDSIVGKTILIHSEQGFGDTIQFFRYLSKLKTLGCKIIFETQTQLAPLIKAQRDNCKIIGQGETLPSFDVHCPLLSLPLAFKTTLETIPAQVPYLFPPPEKLELWRTKLGTKSKPRVGLVWSGKLLPDFRRSIPLDSLLLIIDEKAEWHSLQKDVRESDRNSLNSSLTIIDHAPSLNDFSDTAALIAEMDLVISIDTAVAHLAGALGKPVWILLPFHPDFRWLRDREDSPWYPTARLFRQTQDGEWRSVIDRVFQELKIFLDPKLNPEVGASK